MEPDKKISETAVETMKAIEAMGKVTNTKVEWKNGRKVVTETEIIGGGELKGDYYGE